jgi:glycosyltransferase involved in cell wall biosynthesis
MKILHINSYYGAGSLYKNLYDKQVENGLDIDVFVPVPYSKELAKNDLGDYTMVSTNHGKYDRYIFHLKHYKIYKDVMSKYKIDDYSIIHAHSLFSNGYIAMKLKQQYGVPYIVAVRNTDVNVFFNKMPHLRRLGVKILKEARRIIFLSKSYRDTVIKKYVPDNLKEEIYIKVSIIPNGIDDFWFKNIGIEKNAPDINNLKLLYVGVINKNKNIVTTVKAIDILRQKGYNTKFTIVGRIKDKNVYNQIKDLSFINYILPKSKEELIEIYRENDIFVMPSIAETFGLVYAEAMSQGLPVIYTMGQGFDGQFEEGIVGYSVDCFNADEIANKILFTINGYDSLTRMSIKSVNKFDWTTISNNYIEIYNDLVNILCQKNEGELFT